MKIYTLALKTLTVFLTATLAAPAFAAKNLPVECTIFLTYTDSKIQSDKFWPFREVKLNQKFELTDAKFSDEKRSQVDIPNSNYVVVMNTSITAFSPKNKVLQNTIYLYERTPNGQRYIADQSDKTSKAFEGKLYVNSMATNADFINELTKIGYGIDEAMELPSSRGEDIRDLLENGKISQGLLSSVQYSCVLSL